MTMADDIRTKTVNDSIKKTEAQLQQIQQFVMTSQQFMTATQQFMNESRKQQEEHRRLIKEIGKNTDIKLDELAEMVKAIKDQAYARTLLVKIHREIYPISCRELDKVFFRFGNIEELENFGPGNDFHSRVRFQNKGSSIEALNSFNHKDIYDGCCQMELFLMSDFVKDELRCTSNSMEIVVPDTMVELSAEKIEEYQEDCDMIDVQMDSIVETIVEPRILMTIENAREKIEECVDVWPENEISVEIEISENDIVGSIVELKTYSLTTLILEVDDFSGEYCGSIDTTSSLFFDPDKKEMGLHHMMEEWKP